jgi:hypothetical protein
LIPNIKETYADNCGYNNYDEYICDNHYFEYWTSTSTASSYYKIDMTTGKQSSATTSSSNSMYGYFGHWDNHNYRARAVRTLP